MAGLIFMYATPETCLIRHLRKNQLFINNHNLTFTESAAKYGLDNSGYTTQASFFDYDGDGDLDCFMVNNSPIPVNTLNYANMRDLPLSQTKVADFLKAGGDHLYRNDNGHFTEVTKASGYSRWTYKSWSWCNGWRCKQRWLPRYICFE